MTWVCTVEAPLTWIEKPTTWLTSFVSGPGGRRFKSSLPDQSLSGFQRCSIFFQMLRFTSALLLRPLLSNSPTFPDRRNDPGTHSTPPVANWERPV